MCYVDKDSGCMEKERDKRTINKTTSDGGKVTVTNLPRSVCPPVTPQKNTPAGWLIVTGFVAYLSVTPRPA